MDITPITRRLIVLLTAFPVFGIAAPEPLPVVVKSSIGALDSKQVEAVRGIGRAVLGAKANWAPDPAREATRRELVVLRRDVDQLVSSSRLVGSEIKLASSSATTIRSQSDSASALKRAVTPEQMLALQNHVDNLRSHRENANGGMQMGATASRRAGRSAEHGIQAVTATENTLTEALAAPDGPDLATLATLRHRLQPKNYLEMREEQQRSVHSGKQPPVTPTLTTLTRHR